MPSVFRCSDAACDFDWFFMFPVSSDIFIPPRCCLFCGSAARILVRILPCCHPWRSYVSVVLDLQLETLRDCHGTCSCFANELCVAYIVSIWYWRYCAVRRLTLLSCASLLIVPIWYSHWLQHQGLTGPIVEFFLWSDRIFIQSNCKFFSIRSNCFLSSDRIRCRIIFWYY